ncbi:aspartyl protease family protein [Terrimonas pollutisoli]|uniref:aspartyl protease family protein n=1 Tax=Terrimonas pollutisoli TaxID=3034147 RepID=UPI0023EE0A67|nr:aspartyl protease family protein [Terrimonas sp. H1YJ31]
MKRRKLKLFIVLLLSVSFASAQEEFIEPTSRTLTTIPFTQLTGGVVILQAQLDDFPDTLNFILDSGSSGISLDSTTVAYFKLNPEASDRTIRGIAGIKKVGFLYNRKLRFPNLTVDSLNFHVNDYSVLTSVYGEQIDGIIGFSLLSRYIIKINYDSLKINICSKGTIKYPRGGYLFKPIISTLPVQFGRIKDEGTFQARFLHDIGAGVCLMLSEDFVNDSALIQKKRKLWPKDGEGIGGKVSMNLTIVKEFKLGPYRFRNVPTYIFDDAFNVTSYPYLAGLIGNDLLRRFNVIFNYPKRDIHLVPNSHYRDPFDYSYSGIELYYIDGRIEMGSVAKGSPAELAGIKQGDIVISVNNDMSQNFSRYKTALLAPNTKVKLILRRGEELIQAEMKVKSIF